MRLLVLLISSWASIAAPAAEIAWNTDFPDPSVIRAQDGYYYIYGTQGWALDANLQKRQFYNIQVGRSRDLKTWTRMPDALPKKPAWASGTQNFWAPDIRFHRGLYYLFYSAQHNPNPQNVEMCVGVARSKSPAGPFVDSGAPLVCGNSFENIDPMLFEHPISGRPILYWGSAFKPIRAQELAEDWLSFKPGSTPVEVLRPDPSAPPTAYMHLLEGPWMIFEQGVYYLFVSGDNCCEPKPHYAVMVARSQSPAGPFEMKKDPIIVADHRFFAPGHNSVITGPDGQRWIYYHAVDRSALGYSLGAGKSKFRRILMRASFSFKDGWPAVDNSGE